MDEGEVVAYLLGAFEDVEMFTAMGYRFFFVGPDRMMPFATLAAGDNEHDRVSDLDRPGVYRLNVGVGRATYEALFGPPPPPGEGPAGIVDTGHDFAALDALMPHPVYAPQSWLCVLSPSAATWERVKPLLAEAHERAARRARGREG